MIVGDQCIHCGNICDASALLGMRIDTSKFMGALKEFVSPGYLRRGQKGNGYEA